MLGGASARHCAEELHSPTRVGGGDMELSEAQCGPSVSGASQCQLWETRGESSPARSLLKTSFTEDEGLEEVLNASQWMN